MLAGLIVSKFQIHLDLLGSSGAYLKSFQTLMLELFCINSSRVSTVNIFSKNAPSQMFSWVQNTPVLIQKVFPEPRFSSAEKSTGRLAQKKLL